MEPRIQYAKTEDGVNIAYTTVGEGEPLVFLWNPQANIRQQWDIAEFQVWYEKLAQGRMLVQFDYRGTGLSQRKVSDTSMETLELDIAAVTEHLGLATFSIFGNRSMGPVAISYAAQHPEQVKKLILWHSIIRGSDFQSSSQAGALQKLLGNWDLYTDALAHYSLGWAAGEAGKRFGATIRDGITQDTFMAYQAALMGVDMSDVLPKVQAPTLVLHRHDFKLVSPDVATRLASGIPDAHLVLLKGESGGFALEDSDAVLDAIDEFLGDGHRQVAQASTPAQGEDATQTQISSMPEAKAFASGRYVVVRLLGQGAQKSVYLVDDTVLERQCALSVLNAALLDPNDVDRIKREAQTMAKFGTQPNIVTVHDYGEEDGAPFIVCEYVPGGELRDELTSAAGPLPLERALAVATDICRALSFAHDRNIVHRDLKPENVWLTEERSAKLGDFGIALSLGRTRLTMPGGLTGTAMYMAPEQVSGGDVDARSDLYAFGVLLYELVTGRPPFVGDDPNAIMYQHVNTEPTSPLEHNASVPPSLEGLIMKLLAKTKAERPSSAEEVLAELEHAAAELAGGQAGVPAGVRGRGTSLMEPQIQYAKTEDGVSIAFYALGDGPAFVRMPDIPWSHI